MRLYEGAQSKERSGLQSAVCETRRHFSSRRLNDIGRASWSPLNKEKRWPVNVRARYGQEACLAATNWAGVRQRRAGKDLSSSGPAGRRSLIGPSKLSIKADGSSSKDVIGRGSGIGVQTGAQIGAQAACSRLKCKPQPAITDFLTRGPEITEAEGHCSCMKAAILVENTENTDSTNLVLEPAQAGAKLAIGPLQMVKAQNETENPTAEYMGPIALAAGVAGVAPSTERTQLGHKREEGVFQEYADILREPIGARARSNGNLAIKEALIMQEQDDETGQTERNGRNTDWSKEVRDKFYSLTEDSEAKNNCGTQSDEEDNFLSDL
ncbi:hypothetical protein NDU88_000153 [Pleurodeles waltl]|uniref:Uncharacterized protein n=1 Tax=Pleurodeles waltl TaxID=8319 RepID=A0AAV7KNF7_PLEWA|nr:hypothetical protein NDU88_000153 [Pleurodeles waltl]